ncbi:GlxA family transcriptional regulator [Thalassolituus sp. C2-1]|jgi:transcriptional regulator GlxA family with amidase domain|uniref:GlxA family transcriptional regulator n=1 Tax=Venatorbacter sp. C2-1 TaxID=2597518 RepID=UPI001197CF45|nr:helix-turn-helix domain-containing protein [Thalassolituus sp. C2-1]TVV42651.1 helix-turn-helix domain-containing protein [Thalassolituus sp. C2-1]
MNIGLLLYPDCIPAGLFAFADLLTACNLRLGKRQFRITWLSEPGGALPVANGQTLDTLALAANPPDALLIPGAWRDRHQVIQASDQALVNTLQRLPDNTQLWSYCTGVCLLARSGRLDQHNATTTWWLKDTVSQAFPQVHWSLQHSCLFDEHLATASGVNGYLPIALKLISRHCGAALAEEIRRYMVLPRPNEQNNPFQQLPLLLQQSELLRRIIQWVEQTPAQQVQTSALADHLHLTPATLARRVKQESTMTCAQLLRLIKLNQVSDQLQTSNRSISEISHMLGFVDDSSLRRSFRQLTGLTPGEYRRQFG